MKRAFWLYGTLILALASCSDNGGTNDDALGSVSSEHSLIELIDTEGLAANGSDTAIVRVTAKDSNGRPIPNREVNVRSSSADDTVIIDPPRTDQKGQVEIRVTATEVGTRVLTITVDSINLPHRPTLEFTAGDAAYLEFVETPGTGQAGRPLRPAVRVEVKDERGNRVIDSTADVTLHVGGSEPQTVQAVAGVATFNDIVISEPGEAHVLRATAEGMDDGFSEKFEIIVGTPAQLTFERGPENVAIGEKIAVSVAVRDPAGNVVVDSNEMVRIRLYSNPPAAKLLGTLEVQAQDGIASFDDLEIHKASAGYQLTASAKGYKSAESDPKGFVVGVLNPVADGSELRVLPAEGTGAAEVLGNGRDRLKIVGRIVDAMGNPLSGYPVVLSASGVGHRFHPTPIDGDGTTYRTNTTGTGEFTAWISSTVAETKRVALSVGDLFELEAFATFLPDAVEVAESELVPSVVSAIADQDDVISFEVVARDQNANPVNDLTVSISASGTGNTFLTGTSVRTDENGIAIFDMVSSVAEAKIVTATFGGVSLSSEVHFRAGPPSMATSTLAGDDQGAGSETEVATRMAEPFRIVVRDALGNVISGADVVFELDQDSVDNGASLHPGGGASETLTSDDEGTVELFATVGTKTGPYTISWHAGWDGDDEKELEVFATPAPGTQLVLVNSANEAFEINDDGVPFTRDDNGDPVLAPLSAVAGAAGGVDLLFQLRDQYDNATGDAALTLSGTGSWSPLSPAIGSWSPSTQNPRVAVSWTLQDTAGPNALQVITSNPVQGQPDITLNLAATGSPGVPASIDADPENPTSYTAMVATTLPTALGVYVTDANGNPVPNAGVGFANSHGHLNDGTIPTVVVTTDGDGYAEVSYTLGEEAVDQTVTATVMGYAGAGSAVFTITATPDAPAALNITAGEDQEAAVGEALSAFQVEVVDQFENGVPGVQVDFAITAEAGPNAELSATSESTNSNGLASTILTLGDLPGAYVVTASSAGLTDVTFSANATVGAPASIALVDGDEQSGTVDGPVAQPLVVRVEDNRGNLLENETVTFSGANVSFADATPETGSNGEASTTITSLPQTAGSVTVTATIGTYSVTFNLTAEPDVPHSITEVSGDMQTGAVGTELPQALVVRIADRFDNPVPEFPVSFTANPTAEGGFRAAGETTVSNPGDIPTDEDGLASAYWTLPNTPNLYTAQARVSGVSGWVVFSAEAELGDAAEILVNASALDATVGGTIDVDIIVRDAGGNELEGVEVAFTLSSGTHGASVSNATMDTLVGGTAETTVTVGEVAESFDLTITAGSVVETLTLEALAGPVDSIDLESGDEQSGPVGTALADPMVVSVADQYGNPLTGVDVVFASADGSPASATVSSEDGFASFEFTPETLGENTVTATVVIGGADETVTFTATGLVDADQLVAIAGDGQFTHEGDDFGNPLVVQVLDDVGAPVAGVDVLFEVDAAEGTVAASPVATDADGYAAAFVSSVAGHIGDVVVTASVEDSLLTDVTFTLSAGTSAGCYAGGLSVFSGVVTPWGATPETGIFTAGNDASDTYQIRVVEAVEGHPALGLVYDGVAFDCSWDDGGTPMVTELALSFEEEALVLSVDGVATAMDAVLPAGVEVTEADGWITLTCETGHGFSVQDAGGFFPTVQVEGTGLTGGICADPADFTEVAAPGLFAAAPVGP